MSGQQHIFKSKSKSIKFDLLLYGFIVKEQEKIMKDISIVEICGFKLYRQNTLFALVWMKVG